MNAVYQKKTQHVLVNSGGWLTFNTRWWLVYFLYLMVAGLFFILDGGWFAGWPMKNWATRSGNNVFIVWREKIKKATKQQQARVVLGF